VRREAIRSNPECAASDRIPRLPVLTPTTILRLVMTTAARTEFPAAARFSERITSDEEMAGLSDMQELSPLPAESGKQIRDGGPMRRRARPALRNTKLGGRPKKWLLVLGFDAWHFELLKDQSWRK
jgi:hypothetical protein